MNSEPKLRKIPRGFFIAVHPVIMTLVIAFLYLLLMSWVWPDGVSTKMFGQISDVVAYVGFNYNQYMRIAVITTCVLHVCESFVAVVLCYKLNLKKSVIVLWFFQTLIFGIFSLQYLLWPQSAIINIHSD